MAGKKACPKCGQTEHHDRNCPEMFWPNGKRRGESYQSELDRLDRLHRERKHANT